MHFSSFNREYLRQAGGVSYSNGVWGETGPAMLQTQHNLWYTGTRARFYILCFMVKLIWYIQKESLIHHLNDLSAPNGNTEKVKNANRVDASKASGVAATVLLLLVFISPLNASCLRLFDNSETAHSNITLHLLWHRHIIKGWMKMFPAQEKKGGFTGCRNRLQCLFKTRTETLYFIIPELQTKFSSRLNNYVFQLT